MCSDFCRPDDQCTRCCSENNMTHWAAWLPTDTELSCVMFVILHNNYRNKVHCTVPILTLNWRFESTHQGIGVKIWSYPSVTKTHCVNTNKPACKVLINKFNMFAMCGDGRLKSFRKAPVYFVHSWWFCYFLTLSKTTLSYIGQLAIYLKQMPC